ncbi:phosphatases II [Gonapodya prolifera JEL478]|uniref:Phosphatases II n=1 Tax=Gonapodya prolifera (strain JEL478) TaxID=1344416 RepID=A0A139AUQ1_GONPJ|nr:phosphatases II [Gonapodya prolifera JEL478]|eukprot:KXS20215.1 phosphatases II [Gonapodya prolifera JEL478]
MILVEQQGAHGNAKHENGALSRTMTPQLPLHPGVAHRPSPPPQSPLTPSTLSSLAAIPNHHSVYSHHHSVIQDSRLPITFVITDCPSDKTIDSYVDVFRQYGVKDVVRICDETVYKKEGFESHGVTVHDNMKFEDGGVPSDDVIRSWRLLVDTLSRATQASSDQGPALAVHCVSGVGRAPVLVCMTLVDAGIDPIDAIEIVRKRRRGSLNKKQVNWLIEGCKRVKLGTTLEKYGKSGKSGAASLEKSGGGLFGGLFKKKS